MQGHIWVALAAACLLCRAFCNGENGCANRTTTEIRNNKILRIRLDNGTGTDSFTAATAKECAQLCCNNSLNCNLAEFNFTTDTNNCIHVHCEPIDMCLEDKSDKSIGHVVTYYKEAIEESQPPINETMDKSKTIYIASRTIKPRKGVGELSLAANSSSIRRKNNTLTKNSPSKDQELIPETTTDLSTFQISEFLGNNSIEAAGNSDMIDGMIDATLVEDSTTKIDLPNVAGSKMKHIVPRKGATDSHQWALFPTTASLPAPGLIMDQHPRPPTPTKQIVQSSSQQFSIESSTKLNTSPHAEASTNNPLNTMSQHDKGTGSQPNDPTSRIDDTMESSTGLGEKKENPYHDLESVMKDAIGLSNNISSKLPIKLVVTGSIDLMSTSTAIVGQNLDELHFQQSIYLIVSLLIGFLVLLLVIGMVLKHVYGVWERRHYQRMDFLIDGLYNTRAPI